LPAGGGHDAGDRGPARPAQQPAGSSNHASTYAAASFWWTLGGSDYAPQALCCRRMPDPFLYAKMLTGRFDVAAE
jgi:hypothetical protein